MILALAAVNPDGLTGCDKRPGPYESQIIILGA